MPQQKIKFSKNFLAAIFISLSLTLSASAADELIVLGNTTGIRLYAEGAIIVGLTEEMGSNPCKAAGIAKGDILKAIDGEKILSNSALKQKVESSGGRTLTIEYMRGNETKTAEVTPTKNAAGKYCLGIWIRDSIAGIGTLTFYDPESGKYGALGHGICDSDTGVLIPLEKGALMESKVVNIKRGEVGSPGELTGEYDLSEDYANISKNSDSGIFGKVLDSEHLKNMKKFPVASKDEIKCGKAQIFANLDGEDVSQYEIEIENIYSDRSDTKNMLIHVTDKRLIEKTGGIVRGMSGSPIVQNGKIIGAVTHVLIDDPTRGYGIFIENMLKETGEK